MCCIAVCWNKLPLGLFNLNADASVILGKASGGDVLRDHDGKLVFAFFKEFGEQDVLMAKSSSLLYGLQLSILVYLIQLSTFGKRLLCKVWAPSSFLLLLNK